MGRPLNKKYFGNRNTGSASTTGDDGIGGNRVASVTLNALGSYTTRPTVTFSAPDLAGPGGVTATGTVTSEALSATVSAGGSGFVVGDLLNVTTAGGSAIAYVATVDGSGVIQTVNFTGTGASRGSFTSLGTVTTTVNTSTAGTGTLTLVVTYRAKAVVITEPGSGYTNAADAAPTFTQSVTGTTVLESYSNGDNTGNNENAIRCYAYVTGGSRKVGDIVRQVSTTRYLVETADGREICALVTGGVASAAGEMDITAYDSGSAGSNEYWVKKLTGRRATLVVKGDGTGGSAFATDASAPWSFDAASTGYVQVDNT